MAKRKHRHWERKATANPNKSPKTDSSCPNLSLEDLGDDILVEILHRLPYKQAFICKSVSKSWNSLLSGPQFLLQFISRWQYLFQQHEQHCSFVAHPRHLLVIPNLSSDSLDFLGTNPETAVASLNSLPNCLPNPEVLGYSDGLLLLNIHHSDFQVDNVVFDMITKQLIKLPAPPWLHRSPSDSHHSCNFLGGLVCDRNYYMETADQEAAAGTKFFAVFAPASKCGCYGDNKLQIYSSETGHWRGLSVNFPTRMLVFAGVSYHRLLYFLGAEYHGLIVCDPMRFTSHCLRFPYYRETDYDAMKQCIGVCCGTLRLCQATYLSYGTVNIMVWELRDSGSYKETELGFWDSVQDVCLGPDVWKKTGPLVKFMRRCREYFTGLYNGEKLQIEPLAFHPYNGDILYFRHESSIFSCNLSNKTLEDIPVSGNQDCVQHSTANTFPILVPCWPSNYCCQQEQ